MNCHCQGCDLDRPNVKTYLVRCDPEHPREWSVVLYCENCADLARANWNGNTLEIRSADEVAQSLSNSKSER